MFEWGVGASEAQVGTKRAHRKRVPNRVPE